jgi:hypothetical protein
MNQEVQPKIQKLATGYVPNFVLETFPKIKIPYTSEMSPDPLGIFVG